MKQIALFATEIVLALCVVAACAPVPTPTLVPTVTAVPPTATSIPPTATPVPPTATAVPPTATAVPPTPTATPVPPTATLVPPTPTPTQTPTVTPTPIQIPQPDACTPDPNLLIAAIQWDNDTTGIDEKNGVRIVPTVSGSVALYAIVIPTDSGNAVMVYWKLEVSSDERKTWGLFAAQRRTTATKFGIVWQPPQLPNGNYWLRLLAVDYIGNYKSSCEYLVVVKN